MDVCPYELLELDKRHFTYEQLRANYKRIAKDTHPDKRNGSTAIFKLVHQAYETLVEELERRRVDRTFDQLKTQAIEHYRKAPRSLRKDENFNVQKFNAMFDEHKFRDDRDRTDVGYGDMMEPSTGVREDINIPKRMSEYNADKFNREFERTARVPSEKRMTVRSGPVAFEAGTLAFAELGVTKVDDFSGANSGKSLHFTDYMTAHTTSALVDLQAPKRKEYADLKDLQRERASMSLAATPEDVAARERESRLEQRREQRRQRNLKRRDEAIADFGSRMARMMLN